MPINDWPEEERPREKLLVRGPKALSDAKLLAIFLRTGVTGKSAVDVARELLRHYGGLRALLTAPREELMAVRGFGAAKYVQLAAALELARRFLAEKLEARRRSRFPRRRSSLSASLPARPSPRGVRLLVSEQPPSGARLRRAISRYAQRHGRLPPRGGRAGPQAQRRSRDPGPQPSLGSRQAQSGGELLTRRHKEALSLVEVRLLDHLVVGDGDTVSFSERGLI